jgi:hypothetical protein
MNVASPLLGSLTCHTVDCNWVTRNLVPATRILVTINRNLEKGYVGCPSTCVLPTGSVVVLVRIYDPHGRTSAMEPYFNIQRIRSLAVERDPHHEQHLKGP